jgi:hypothetical protein
VDLTPEQFRRMREMISYPLLNGVPRDRPLRKRGGGRKRKLA